MHWITCKVGSRMLAARSMSCLPRARHACFQLHRSAVFLPAGSGVRLHLQYRIVQLSGKRYIHAKPARGSFSHVLLLVPVHHDLPRRSPGLHYPHQGRYQPLSKFLA